MKTITTTITSDDGSSYVVSVDSVDTSSSTVYISDEGKNDVEIPLSVFLQMSRIVNAVS